MIAERKVATGLTVMEVTPNLEVGGAQETVRTLASQLPRIGFPTVVCTFGDGPLRSEIEALGVPVVFLPARRHSVVALPLFVAEMVRLRRRLLDVVREHRVDVVQTQGLGTLDFLVMTIRRRGRPQVWWTIQNERFTVRAEHLPRHRWLVRPKRAVHRVLYRIGARIIDGVIAVSDETARSFRSVAGDVGTKVTVVGNAVDVERYLEPTDRETVRTRLGFGSDDHLMTMVGTFKAQKGHRTLVEAAGTIVSRFPRLQLLLVGDGELVGEIRDQVHAAGLSDRIHFLGTRRDVPDLLAASDSFVLPSLWEGLSLALVEAMASGLPIVATDVSGTSRLVIDGVTGRLVPPGDPKALAEAMADLLEDPASAARLAAAGRELVAASFGTRDQAERLAALFRGVAR